jgi:hypothetical protein
MNVLALFAAAAAASQPAPAAPYPVFGMANATCRDWTVMKSDNNLRAAQEGFAAGVLTGANLTARRNVTGKSDRDRLLSRVDQQCARSDLQKVRVVEILKALFASTPRGS